MTRYGFNIKTRSGQLIDNISIMAPTREDAERRLRQMYRECRVVECRTYAVAPRYEGTRAGATGAPEAPSPPSTAGAADGDGGGVEPPPRWLCSKSGTR